MFHHSGDTDQINIVFSRIDAHYLLLDTLDNGAKSVVLMSSFGSAKWIPNLRSFL